MVPAKKKWALCLLPLVVSALFCGCSPVVKENGPVPGESGSYEAVHYPVDITNINSKGEEEVQTFKEPPKRVVAVWQNSIETLLALGVGDRIVAGMGIPSEKYILPEYRADYEKIPYTSLENLDMETIMMMKPDFIVGWYSTF